MNETRFWIDNDLFQKYTNYKIPEQGLKLHISTKNKKDYELLLSKLLPDMIKKDIPFKYIKPKLYDSENRQFGKDIVLYQGNWNAYDFLKNHKKELFFEKGICVKGDKYLSGRIYGRFGSFIKRTVKDKYIDDYLDKIILNPNVSDEEMEKCEELSKKYEYVNDDRSISKPFFVDDFSLNDFCKLCAGELTEKDLYNKKSLKLIYEKDNIKMMSNRNKINPEHNIEYFTPNYFDIER